MAVAVIQTGGKQYLVREGEEVVVEHLKTTSDAKVDFTDLLSGKKVTGTVVAETRALKIDARKFRAKVRYLRRHGHRQHQTRVRIEKIG